MLFTQDYSFKHNRKSYAITAASCVVMSRLWPEQLLFRTENNLLRHYTSCIDCVDIEYRKVQDAHCLTAEHWSNMFNVPVIIINQLLEYYQGFVNDEPTDYGYRNFQVSEYMEETDGPHYTLKSPIYEMVWEPTNVMQATCKYNGIVHNNGHCPMPLCTCGFYVFWNLLNTLKFGLWSSVVTARVRIGGKIIEHEYGARAEYAVIEALVPMRSWSLTNAVSQDLGIPILGNLPESLDKDELWD